MIDRPKFLTGWIQIFVASICMTALTTRLKIIIKSPTGLKFKVHGHV